MIIQLKMPIVLLLGNSVAEEGLQANAASTMPESQPNFSTYEMRAFGQAI